MPVHTCNSVAPPERRLHVRQRVEAIIYLDIGADNGGMVMNLSEEGMRFQAVGPLDKQGELRLRSKLPSFQMRIDAAKQIAWLSNLKRKAGVRFLDAQSEGAVQIQEWIRSQASRRAPLEESSKQGEEVTESQGKQEAIRKPQRDKRNSLMSEFEFSEVSRQHPPEIGSGGTRHCAPIAREDPVSPQKPDLVSQPFDEHAKSHSTGHPAMQEASSRAETLQAPLAHARWEPEGGDVPIARPSDDELKGESTLDWPAPISGTTAMAIPLLPDAPLKPPEPIAPGAQSQANSIPAAVNTIVAAPAGTDLPEEGVTTLATLKEQESNPPVAPALDNPDAAASGPRIVARLILKPSDRFHPCYLAHRVEAAYPAQAQGQRIEEVVKTQQGIGTDGRVRGVKLWSGPPILVSAALEGARCWRHLPCSIVSRSRPSEMSISQCGSTNNEY
jgi:hypothetical protein